MPVSSPIANVAIPDQDITSYFFEQAQRRVDRLGTQGCTEPAIVTDAQTKATLRFSDIKCQAQRIAGFLRSLGFGGPAQGSNLPDGLNDVAAVLAPNDIAFSAIHFGTLIAGGTYMAVNPQQSVQALAHQLKDVDARVVFTTAHLLPVLQQVCDAAGLDIPTSNIVLIQGCSDGFTTLETAIDGAAAIESHRVTSPEELNRVALIVYSSGTTGKAKGIMLTHRNIVSMYVMVGGYSARSHAHGDSDSAASVQPQSNVLSALPLYFLYGHCVLCYQPLTSGDLIVQMAGFELDPYLAAIDSYKINRLSLTPAVLYDIAAGITKIGSIAQSAATGNRYDIGSVRMVGCGGASLPHALKKSYSQLLNGSPIIQGYGMAESTSIIAGSSWATPCEGAVGVLYPNSSAMVIGTDGQETGGFGELCVSGPHVMHGYVNTATSPVASGFLRTGDYARVSTDGHVFLRGRIADIVYTAEGAVVPTDVENALANCSLVRDCAVKGEGPKGSAMPVAYIVPREAAASDNTLQQISQWAKTHAGVAVECRTVEAIPKSPAGKVLRYLLGQASAQ